jgi:hypothetical protein
MSKRANSGFIPSESPSYRQGDGDFDDFAGEILLAYVHA